MTVLLEMNSYRLVSKHDLHSKNGQQQGLINSKFLNEYFLAKCNYLYNLSKESVFGIVNNAVEHTNMLCPKASNKRPEFAH